MNNKVLGFCGLLGAPWLFLGMTLEEKYPLLKGTWFSGAWELLYISGWMCTVNALQRVKATGGSRFGKYILWVLLGSLTIANISNVVLLLYPTNQPAWWFWLDLFWPVSNLIMLVTGIVVARANVLTGWQRWIPLAVGCWFPLAMISLKMNPSFSFLFGGFYSAVAWSLLALAIITGNHSTSADKEETIVHCDKLFQQN